MKLEWVYHSEAKWYETSAGWGKFVVQKSRGNKQWISMQVPFLGNPTVLGVHENRQAAQKSIEDLHDRFKK